MSAKNYNEGKPRPSLVLGDMPNAFAEMVKLREAGTIKYDKMNWAESINTDDAKRFQQAYSLFSEQEKAKLNPGAPDSSLNTIQYWLNWLDNDTQGTGAERMMRIDTRMNLADDLLLYGDKISMAFALETRVPMLDIELMKFVLKKF